MSEPMDLIKARDIENRLRGLRNDLSIEVNQEIIAKALALERRRLIEKFRPVIENLRQIEETADNHGRAPYSDCEGTSSISWLAEEAIKLFHELEKENG